MAFLEFKNVRIAGMSAGVPKNVFDNTVDSVISKDYEADAFVQLTGVKERRLSKVLTTSDLCYGAAEKLIKDLSWDKTSIGAIIFVSQTPDYVLPATSCILQDRLGLSKDCYSLDVSLGCSGWVYGLSTAMSIVNTGCISRALLLAGDGKEIIDTNDPLFGHAGSVTALEFVKDYGSVYFHFGTDGSGYDAIIKPDGGCRNSLSEESFEVKNVEGVDRCRLNTQMKGMDVFSFGISIVPKSVIQLSNHFLFDYQAFDFYVLHQANMKMNNFIVKKLRLSKEKVPTSMYNYGNTSSASIPLTIVSQLVNKADGKGLKFLCCGFGVGLSWGTVAFATDDRFVVSPIVELSDDKIDKRYVI